MPKLECLQYQNKTANRDKSDNCVGLDELTDNGKAV